MRADHIVARLTIYTKRKTQLNLSRFSNLFPSFHLHDIIIVFETPFRSLFAILSKFVGTISGKMAFFVAFEEHVGTLLGFAKVVPDSYISYNSF